MCSFISWVDNAFFAGKDPVSALKLAEIFSVLLEANWGQHIKPSSRVLLVPKWWSHCEEQTARFTIKHSVNVLGQLVSWNGAVAEDVEFQHMRVRASFFRNAGSPEAKRLSDSYKLRLVAISDLASVRSAWARWPWTQTRCEEIDRWQRALVG